MFLTLLVTTPSGKNRWQLIERLDYASSGAGFIRIPKGFVTDLASIPRPLRLFFSVNGDHREAAVLHDYGYSRKGAIRDGVVYTRKQVDELFLEAMERLGVGYLKRKSMYFAVRIGGYFSW